jgi:two-component system chemotaxis sensor kinase CheA
MEKGQQSAVGALDISQFHGVFFEETAENINAFEDGLLKLDLLSPDPEELNAIFRAAHSIKGGSGTFGFDAMAKVTHELETLLDLARRNEMRLDTGHIDALLQAGDVLKAQLAYYRGQTSQVDVDVPAVCNQLNRLVAKAKEAPLAAAAPVPAKPTADDSFGFFDDFPASETSADAVEPASGKLIAADESYGLFEPLADLSAQSTHGPQELVAAPRPDSPGAAAHPGRRSTDRSPIADASSIRVSVEKVDQLINLVGELVITQAMLTQASATMDRMSNETLFDGLAQLERNTRDLQESVMAVRMMPIATVFNRFPRMVRDLAGKLGKEVQLKIVGESTELDKGLIEKLADPLTHLVRNSIDHGLEAPEARIAGAKPATGTITLRAFHQGGSIVVEVADDGGGLSRERIVKKARERGMTIDDNAPDGDIWALIFEAGFSTADVVTDVSGRGVGMDVVRRNIDAMGGRIEISSTPGKGTSTIIRLPLTMAILEGMSVSVNEQTFIVPLAHVIESLAPTAGDIKSLSGMARVVQIRDSFLPVIRLQEMFGMQSRAEGEDGILIVIDSDGVRAALEVDALLGQHQVVIKSLEANYRKVAGLSGATIMGDGMVALILDVPAIVRMSRQ